jgi:hypothetical protein
VSLWLLSFKGFHRGKDQANFNTEDYWGEAERVDLALRKKEQNQILLSTEFQR